MGTQNWMWIFLFLFFIYALELNLCPLECFPCLYRGLQCFPPMRYISGRGHTHTQTWWHLRTNLQPACLYYACSYTVARHHSQLCSAAHWKACFSVCNTASRDWAYRLWIWLYYVLISGQFLVCRAIEKNYTLRSQYNVWSIRKHFR